MFEILLDALLWIVKAFFVLYLIFGVIHITSGIYRGE